MRYIFTFITTIICIGCSPTRSIPFETEDFTSLCYDRWKHEASLLETQKFEDQYFPSSLNLVVTAMEVDEELEKIKNEDLDEIEDIRTRQKIMNRIMSTTHLISAFVAALACEEEKLDQVTDYLEQKESNRQTRLTVGTIVIGAGSSITGRVSNFFTLASSTVNIIEGIRLGAALVDAFLAFQMLTMEEKIDLNFEENIFIDLEEGIDYTSYIPPQIYLYLKYKKDSEDRGLLDGMIEDWKGFLQEGDFEKIMQGEGEYNINQLKRRSDLLDQLQAEISKMKYDLMELSELLEE